MVSHMCIEVNAEKMKMLMTKNFLNRQTTRTQMKKMKIQKSDESDSLVHSESIEFEWEIDDNETGCSNAKRLTERKAWMQKWTRKRMKKGEMKGVR